MADRSILLMYRRTETDLCSGALCLRDDEAMARVEFDDVDFIRMMARTAGLLQESGAVEIWVERTDRPGLRPYLLDAAITELLRTDPVQAIRSLNPQPVAQPVGTPTRSRTVISQKMAPVLRAGHDTLADGIGDEVYSARNATNEIECPVCGRWTPTVDAAQERFWCPGCDVLLSVRMAGHWAVFQIEELLALNKTRYYLPRAWNKTRSWISFQDLTEQYNHWKKIKENTP